MEKFNDREFTEERIRHIPRNQYQHCDVDPLLRYFYRYKFDHYCLRFEVRDIELNHVAERFESVLDVVNHLVSKSNELGIPIISEGLACYTTEVDADDPYFVCRIWLDYMGKTIKPRAGNRTVYRVWK